MHSSYFDQVIDDLLSGGPLWPQTTGRPRRFTDLPADDPYKERLADVGAWLPEAEAAEYYEAMLTLDWMDQQDGAAREALRLRYEVLAEEARHAERVARHIKDAVRRTEALAAQGAQKALADHARALKYRFKRGWPAGRYEHLCDRCNAALRRHGRAGGACFTKATCERCGGEGSADVATSIGDHVFTCSRCAGDGYTMEVAEPDEAEPDEDAVWDHEPYEPAYRYTGSGLPALRDAKLWKAGTHRVREDGSALPVTVDRRDQERLDSATYVIAASALRRWTIADEQAWRKRHGMPNE